jgi:flagellar biosynthesis/type III secretory pathway M-ring protein FliF/YscJ
VVENASENQAQQEIQTAPETEESANYTQYLIFAGVVLVLVVILVLVLREKRTK